MATTTTTPTIIRLNDAADWEMRLLEATIDARVRQLKFRERVRRTVPVALAALGGVATLVLAVL
jgi:hypothetical protein